VLIGTVLPVDRHRGEELFSAILVVQRAVLGDDGPDGLGMLEGEPESNWGAEIHHVQREALDAECIEQTVDDLGDVVETVSELCSVRGVTVPEGRVVGRDDVIGVGELRDQVAEHA
jgi:hypothetical protein